MCSWRRAAAGPRSLGGRLSSNAPLCSLPPTQFSAQLYLVVVGIEVVFTVNKRFHGAEQSASFLIPIQQSACTLRAEHLRPRASVTLFGNTYIFKVKHLLKSCTSLCFISGYWYSLIWEIFRACEAYFVNSFSCNLFLISVQALFGFFKSWMIICP